MTFSFIQNPTGQAMSDGDLVTSALDQPMSLGSTFWDQAKGGVLESFGLGTAIREGSMPAEAPTTPELTITPPEGGEPVLVPDTPQMRRRITAFESVNPQNLQSRAESQQELQQRQDAAGALNESAYKASPYFRKDIPWQQGMTAERAAALAEMDDIRKVREYYGQKRPVTAFFGNLAGQAIDPINYIPVAGEAVAAANVARFGRIAGRALTSSIDAAANTALAGLATAPVRAQFGDDVSWQSTVSQIAMAALIGGAFGAVHGRFGRQTPSELRAEAEAKLATLDNVQASRVALNDALDGMIRDSEVSLTPASTEFVAKAADVDVPKVTRATPVFEREDFRTWFGNSAIVDESGAPRVAYHGTGGDFDEFKLDQAGTAMDAGKLGRGFYFSTRADIASGYANAAADRGGSPNVMPVYLSVENPLVFDASQPGNLWTKLRAQSKEWGIELDPVKDESTANPNDAWAYAFTEVAQENGFDGVVLKFRDGHQEIAVFNPSQIKSTLNRGQFSKESPKLIDTSAPTEAPDMAVVEASKRVGKPEATRALAEQYRVNPETGDFPELADIEQLRSEGRLTEDDLAALDDADETIKTANAYGEALKSFASCII